MKLAIVSLSLSAAAATSMAARLLTTGNVSTLNLATLALVAATWAYWLYSYHFRSTTE